MKKIFTLFAGLLMTAAVFAADRRPTVMLNNDRNFRVVIDGRSYFGDNVRVDVDNFFGSRQHTIKVYQMGRGFFQRERLVDASTFYLGRNDIMINIDRMGDINIREMNSMYGFPRRDRDDRGWNDRDDRGNSWQNGRDDRGYGNGQIDRDRQIQIDRDRQIQIDRDRQAQIDRDHQDNHDSRDGRGRGF